MIKDYSEAKEEMNKMQNMWNLTGRKQRNFSMSEAQDIRTTLQKEIDEEVKKIDLILSEVNTEAKE